MPESVLKPAYKTRKQ